MKKYKVNVNGNLYEITIEEADVNEVASKNTGTPKKTASGNTPGGQNAVPSGAEKITSPMPGTILSVNVSNGDRVKKGQVLMILEAMKMENEIMAPKDGKISGVNVSKGASVESGSLLCVIE